ncbi:hypothetical protein TcWFU_009430 [Taenia crassiceps]|uniref:Uncharacterized protein n=1 Tax=Taenia crassiceps TaxID=6207 RepID=A0ABR4PZB6_9CEST
MHSLVARGYAFERRRAANRAMVIRSMALVTLHTRMHLHDGEVEVELEMEMEMELEAATQQCDFSVEICGASTAWCSHTVVAAASSHSLHQPMEGRQSQSGGGK